MIDGLAGMYASDGHGISALGVAQARQALNERRLDRVGIGRLARSPAPLEPSRFR